MKGSAGGHNGLKDLQDKLNTSQYNRLRFGISDEFAKGRQVDYVLGNWTDEEADNTQRTFGALQRIYQKLCHGWYSKCDEHL